MCIGGSRLGFLAGVSLAAACFAIGGCKTTPPEEETSEEVAQGPHAELIAVFPTDKDVADWAPSGEAVDVYALTADPEQGVKPLADDVGSAADIYGQYGFVKSGTCRYERGQSGEAVTLRLFEMESPSEAFGVFSIQAEGTKFPTLGLAARMTTKTLAFVKGRSFVLIEYDGPGDGTNVLMDFGRWVADQITSRGYRPSIMESFPPGSVQDQRYYLHAFDTLALLNFVPKADPGRLRGALGLGPQTDVAIIGYPTAAPETPNYLFLVRYPTEADAEAAYQRYTAYLDGSEDPAERNVAVAPPVRMYLAGTLNAEENSIRDRLAGLLEGLGG